MAISVVSVETSELGKCAASMNESCNEIGRLIDEMEQLIVHDLRADWHGDTNHRKFRDTFKRGLTELRASQRSAQDMAAYIERAAALYKEMEAEVDAYLSKGSFADPTS